jgi:CDP-glucose 4,6-dehydratase
MVYRPRALEAVEVNSFWNSRKVFVTGHTGFKGGWLTLWLRSLGARVTGYSLPPDTIPNLFNAARVGEGIASVIEDVRSYKALLDAIKSSEAEVIFHLAAQPLVRRGYLAPRETYETNVMGVVNVLDAARLIPSVRAVVIVTSDKCYENREWLWGYREDEPMGGFDPYSSSKGCAELVTSAFRRSYFTARDGELIPAAIASVRAGNVIGGGDWSEDRLLPDFVRAATSGRRLEVRNPVATRPWQHVLDPLHGYLTLAERLASGDMALATGWNFGPSEEDTKPVSWVADQAVSRWGNAASWSPHRIDQVHEARHLKLDSSRARALLGWRPRFTSATAIDVTIDWYKAFYAGEDMQRFTLSQISHLMSEGSAV